MLRSPDWRPGPKIGSRPVTGRPKARVAGGGTDHRGRKTGGREAGKRRSELEVELAHNKLAQAQLQQELEEVQKQLQTLKENYLAEKSRLEGRTEELLAEQATMEQKLRTLTEALAFETKRRGAIEKMAVESFKRCRELEGQLAKQQTAEKTLQGQLESPEGAKRRGELEAELTRNKGVQAKLCEPLKKARKQLHAQPESSMPNSPVWRCNCRSCNRRKRK